MSIFILWIALSLIVSFSGNGKKVGFWGVFLLSLIFSPLIGLIVGLVSSSEPKKYWCPHCHYESNEWSKVCPKCGHD